MNRYAAVFAALALMTSLAQADRRRPVHLSDRVGEAHLVVVATAESARVVPLSTPWGDRRYVVVADLRVEDTWKGTTPPGGHLCGVALATPTAIENFARMHTQNLPTERAIWLLRECPDLAPAEYLTLYRAAPSKPEDWDAYAAPFRAKAQAMQPWRSLRLDLSLRAERVVAGQAAQVALRLRAAHGQAARIPDDLTWKGHVRLVVTPDVGGYEPEIFSTPMGQPDFEITGIETRDGESIPAKFRGSAEANAQVNFMPSFRAPPGTTAIRCVAQLIDDDGRTLVQSSPVRISLVNVRESAP